MSDAERWWPGRADLLIGQTITAVHDDGGRPVLVLNGGPTAMRFNEWASEIDAELISWPDDAIVRADGLRLVAREQKGDAVVETWTNADSP